MRDLKNFSAAEWLCFKPFNYAFKQFRNDLMLEAYKRGTSPHLDPFLEKTAGLYGSNIALIVAFEQPWALDWLLTMAAKNVADSVFIVCDNSLSFQARGEIEEVCKKNGVLYFPLPPNRTRHVNRSHANAMTWIFYNLVSRIKPRNFAFIDHDMIPIRKTALFEKLGSQPVYGFRRASKIDDSWNLWAGYCFYDYGFVENLKLNFLYDFSRGLDTGGRNWDCLYGTLNHEEMSFADNRLERMADPVNGNSTDVQIIDDCWLHIGGISYNNNFASKSEFCRNLADSLNDGA